jgi:hypothetical protein
VQPRVNKWLDLLDRAGWAFVVAAAAAGLTYLTDSNMSWDVAIKFVAFAGLGAALKVIVGQNTGSDDTGALIGTPVIEPAPKDLNR